MNLLKKLSEFFLHCFQQFHQTKFLTYCMAIFVMAFTCYWLLLKLKQRGKEFPLSRFLFINADKSDSNALQAGGLPFSIISIFSIGLLFYWFPYLINNEQAQILKFAFFSWLGILIYGHLDDRFEIRPIVKLGSQLFLVSIFNLNAANIIMPYNSALVFIIMMVVSITVLNGTNLMDGLDTLSFKVASIIYLGYVILAAYILSLPALFLATSCFFIMFAFYFFNREPSKIHLGEVGVSCLGFSYIILSTMIFEGYCRFNPPFWALTKALVPIVLVLNEAGISFFRRLINGKSPLRGDKLHIHHILTSVHGLSASRASSVIALVYLVFLGVAFTIMEVYSSVSSFIVLTFLSLSWSVLVGRKHWFSGQFKVNIFDALLVKEDVKIISSNSLSDFSVMLTNENAKKEP